MRYEDSPRMVVHLEECEPDGKGWEPEVFGGLLDSGAVMCPAVEYMTAELYADEPVWVERVTEATP